MEDEKPKTYSWAGHCRFRVIDSDSSYDESSESAVEGEIEDEEIWADVIEER